MKTIAPPSVSFTTETPPSSTASFFILLTGGVCIGFAPIFVRLSETGPVATAFWRMALSLPPLYLALCWNQRREIVLSEDAVPAASVPVPWGPMALAGFLFAADLGVWHWSLHFTSVANSTLLSNFAPVFVVVLGAILFGMRVTGRFVGAMLVALAGTCLLVGHDLVGALLQPEPGAGRAFHLDPRALVGDALAIVTAFFYGSYQLSIKALRAHHGTLLILVRSGLVAMACLLPVALASGETILPRDTRGWSVLLALALVVHAGGQGMIAYALARLPAAVASVGLLVQPVTAALAAAIILHEPVAAVQIAGIVLVLAGVVVARQEGR